MRGSILRGWRNIVARGYVAVYQDCRGRHGSEGEDRVYADDAADGYDTLDWIAGQDWCNQRVGMSGSSAGAITTFAAAACLGEEGAQGARTICVGDVTAGELARWISQCRRVKPKRRDWRDNAILRGP